MTADAQSCPARRVLTLDEFMRLRRVSSPDVSPDGRAVAFVASTPDLAENRLRSVIHLASTDGATCRQLTSGASRDTNPVFSPDGRNLAFLSDRGGGAAQLHVLPLDGGEARGVTQLPVDVVDPKWLPDSRRLAFLAVVPPDAPSCEAVKKIVTERAESKLKVRVTQDRLYRFWDRWLTDGDYHHVFIVDCASGHIQDLTPGMRRLFDPMEPEGAYDISPDGTELVFAANTTPPPYHSLVSGIFTVATSGKGPIRQISPEDGYDHDNPRYSPDGRWIVWGRQLEPDFYADPVRLIRYERRSGFTQVLAAGWDASCAEWAFTTDSRSLLLVAEGEQRSQLFSLPVAEAGRLPVRVASPGWISAVHAAGEGRAVALASSLTRPTDVVSIELADGSIRPCGRLNLELMSSLELGEVRDLRFPGADGDPVSMLVVLPPGYDSTRRYPLVQIIHGGPHGCCGDDWHWRWNPQLFAARGFVVAEVNFHGSTGFGERFLRSICGAQPFKPFDDVMAATDHLIETGLADPAKLTAAGASYGGYLIGWIAGHTDRFRALVNHAGCFDLTLQIAEDATYGTRHYYGSFPWDGEAEMANLQAQGPNQFTHRMKTPMLLTHGEQDFRVPFAQSLEAYNILQARKVPTKLVTYADENHWILRPGHSAHWYGQVFDWLERWVAEGAPLETNHRG